MKNIEIKIKRRIQRKRRVRAKVIGTAARPRLSVFRSNVHIYAQLIDDENGKTLISFSDIKLKKEPEGSERTSPEQSRRGRRTKTQIAEKVGEELAKKALAKKIKTVIFDRNGFAYHGRVRALAEAARKGGLVF